MESKAKEEALAEAKARELEKEKEQKEEEAELAAAIKLSKQLDHEQEVESARQRLLNFPEPNTGSNTNADISMIRFTLPNGLRLQRRFAVTDTLQCIRDFIFVASHESKKPLCHFDFGTNFPRRTFLENENNEMTIKNAGLYPQVMLFVTQTPSQRDLDKEELQKEVQAA